MCNIKTEEVQEFGTIKIGERFRCKVTDRKTSSFGSVIIVAGLKDYGHDGICSVTTQEENGMNGCSYYCFHDQFLREGSVEEQAYFENRSLVKDFIVGNVVYHTGSDQSVLKDQPFRVLFVMDDIVILEDMEGKANIYSRRRIDMYKQFTEINHVSVSLFI